MTKFSKSIIVRKVIYFIICDMACPGLFKYFIAVFFVNGFNERMIFLKQICHVCFSSNSQTNNKSFAKRPYV